MKRLFVILMLGIAAAAYFSHADTAVSSVCYAKDCPDGCSGGGSDDSDSGPDSTDDGGGSDSGGGSDPDGSGGGGDF